MVSCTAAPQHAAATPSPSPSPSPSPVVQSPSPSPSPRPLPAQRAEASLPVALEEAAAATAGDKLYVIGGFGAAGNSLQTVWVFDGNSWGAGPRLPLGLDHSSAAVMDDHVYVAGGHNFGRDSPRVFRLAGGRSPATTRVDCFNFESSAWARLPDLPRPTSGAGATTLDDGSAVILGGQDAGETTINDQFARLPNTDSWSSAGAMLVPRHGFELAMFQGRAWACGGGSQPGLHPVATCTSIL